MLGSNQVLAINAMKQDDQLAMTGISRIYGESVSVLTELFFDGDGLGFFEDPRRTQEGAKVVVDLFDINAWEIASHFPAVIHREIVVFKRR